jgi:hypothetical protein
MLYELFSRCERAFLGICPDVVAARYKSASFLVRLGFDIFPAAEQAPKLEYQTKLAIPVPQQSTLNSSFLAAKVFLPACRPDTASTRTVLVVHGFADSGYNDGRIVNFARAMSASCGALVVLPNFPQLVGCRMSDAAVASIRVAIGAIANDPKLCPSRVVSVAAFCVCAGFAVLASADAGPVVDAILCIGAYADLPSLIEFCVREEGRGDSSYGINAALSNFWRTDDPIYRELFLTELRDDHHLRKGKPSAELPRLLEMYPEQGRDFQRLYSDRAFLEHSMRSAFADHKEESMRLSLTPTRIKTIVCASVTLVHASVDGIIPPSESVVLHRRLLEHTAIPTRLCITPLLNHGDKQKLTFSSIYELVELIDGFSMFFRKQDAL